MHTIFSIVFWITEMWNKSSVLTTIAGVVRKNRIKKRKVLMRNHLRYQNREEIAKFPLLNENVWYALLKNKLYSGIPIDLIWTRREIHSPTVWLKKQAQTRRSRVRSTVPACPVIKSHSTSLMVGGKRNESNSYRSFHGLRQPLKTIRMIILIAIL